MIKEKPRDIKICKIEDPRIVGYTNRTRSGREQVFYTGSDERDFDRWRDDGGPSSQNVEMHDKTDTIRINPPEKHYYSQLIDGQWWWVNGCGECNGRARGWDTYIECDNHDVCRTCKKKRNETKTAWGGSNGWQCGECQEREHTMRRTAALEAVTSKEYDEYDYLYNDNIICPHCASSYEFDGDIPEGDEICDVCDGEYTVEPEHSVTFSTKCKGQRIIK